MAGTAETGALRVDPFASHPGSDRNLRHGLVTLAEYLTDMAEYPDPWALFAAFVPWQRDLDDVIEWSSELLRLVVIRSASPASFNAFEIEMALDYLTGVR